MPTLKTEGFKVSALPRAPDIPRNIGMVDVKAIDEGVRRGLATFEAIRQAPRSMILADETTDTEIAKAQAARQVLPAQTQAILSDTPNRSSILSGQAQLAQRGLPLAEQQIGQKEEELKRVQAAQQLATAQFADFTDAYANAQNLADYASKAHELEQLPVKFPWITQVPEYKTLLGRIQDSTTAARTAAAQEAARLGAVELAQTRSATKPLTGTPYLLNRMDELRKAAETNPDDETILRAIDDTQAALNTISAQSQRDPTSDRQSRERVAQMRSEATVNAAKTKYEATKRAGQSKSTAALEAAQAQTSRLDSLIDDAVGKVGFFTTGYGAALANLPDTDARSLRETLETIKANLGFNELREMRLSSPTGGALGNVTERELAFLQKTIQSLDQYLDGDDLRRRLELVREDVKQSWDRVRRAYQLDYGNAPTTGTTATAAKSFANEAELEAAATRGEVRDGDSVTVGGASGKYRPSR